MLKQIEEKLKELAAVRESPMEAVAYGLLPRGEDVKTWNYFVFNRDITKTSGTSKNDFNDYYAVHIVHEDYIPEGYIQQVITKLKEIKGLRLAESDIQYNYTKKGGTDIVVEIATVRFTKAIKGCVYR